MSLSFYHHSHFPTQTTHFLLPGPTGDLEVRVTPHVGSNTQPHTGIICHPHPQQGGTMHNKVVTSIERAFKESNIDTVRFNFRGIGQSAGYYDEGKGELQDLFAILKWVQSVRPNSVITLAGFSFGSFIAASASSIVQPHQLVLIAPPVAHTYFQSMPALIDCPWLVVQGIQDTVVNPNAVDTWVNQQSAQGQYHTLPQADHFFHGQLIELRQCITQSLRPID